MTELRRRKAGTAARPRLLALVASLLTAVGLLVLGAGPASAHAQVVSSTPADGQRLEASPTELVFTISEPADPATVVVSVVGPAGPVSGLGTATSRGENADGKPVIVVPVTTAFPTGLYRMTFSARSSVDGHNATSQIVFGVRTDVVTPAGADGATSADDPIDIARGLLQGMLLISSGLAFGLTVVGGGYSRRRTVRAASVCAAVAAVGVGAIWSAGNGLVVAVCGVAGAWMLWGARAADTPRTRTILASTGLVVGVAPLALVGHVAALGDLMTGLDAVHLVTTAAWMGSVVAAGITMRHRSGADRREILGRASRVGGATFLAAVVTGLVMSQAMVPSVGGLLGSLYGGGLALKALLVLPILALALVTRTALRRGRTPSVAVEAVLITVVAVLGVLVATQPPPASARFQPTPTWQADTAAVSEQSDDLLVSSEIDPNTPGDRFLVVRVDSSRRPAPAPVAAVSAALGDDELAPLERSTDGLWTGSVRIDQGGPTPLVVKVERPGLPDAIVSTTWTVAPTPGTYVGGERLTRYVALAVGGLVAAWLLMLVVEGLLRPRRRVDLTDDRHELDREALTL